AMGESLQYQVDEDILINQAKVNEFKVFSIHQSGYNPLGFAVTAEPLELQGGCRTVTLTIACEKDGFEAVKNLMEADLVFLDPPFHPDADKDWASLIDTCNILKSKHIRFVAWYPFNARNWPQELVDKTGATAWESHWNTDRAASGRGLIGCGMLFSDRLQPLIREAQEKIDQLAGVMNAKIIIREPNV
ncbi:MAG: hypothetical protein MI802_27065, partial [Desulfobacterales bacterium]|nr:hypothetical protein [Desulfobacterales bacterium]